MKKAMFRQRYSEIENVKVIKDKVEEIPEIEEEVKEEKKEVKKNGRKHII